MEHAEDIDSLRECAGSLHDLVERYLHSASGNRSPRAQKRAEILQQWKARLVELDLWDERLRVLGVSEDDLDNVLGYSRVHNEVWEKSLLDVLSERETVESKARYFDYGDGLPPLPEMIERFVQETLFRAVRSRLTSATKSFLRDINSLALAELMQILGDVHNLLLPSLVTELHVEAERGSLDAVDAKDRFDSFSVKSLSSRTWTSEYLATYPVALRLVSDLVFARTTAFIELLIRFETDFDSLREAGLIHERGAVVVELSPASGDRHRGGRAVRILKLSCGTQLVYKPRDVTVDESFGKFLAWIDAGAESNWFRSPLMLRKAGYGWFEFVEETQCEDEIAVRRFYRRQGGNLAALYLLGGYDFFSENVRAHSEYPILLDLECVHAPLLPPHNGRLFESSARRYLEESVYRTGVLPAWTWSYLGRDGVNISPLTDNSGQTAPVDRIEWVDKGSDRLRQEMQPGEFVPDVSSLPRIGDTLMPVNGYLDDLLEGFRSVYALIGARRDELNSSNSPLRCFADAELRVVLRNTTDYSTILREARHPRHWRDGLCYSRFLDRLWSSRCPRYTSNVLESEIRQLWSGDIPIFTTRGASRSLFDDQGKLIESHYFEESAYDGAIRRLARWSESDCERQIEIMNGAFAISERQHVGGASVLSSFGAEFPIEPIRSHEALFLQEATVIGNRILSMGIEDEQTLTWLGLGANRSGQWEQSSLDASLYDGGPGVALLLLGLYKVTGDVRFRDAFRKVLRFGGEDAAREVVKSRARLPDWITFPANGYAFPFSALYLAMQAERMGHDVELDLILDAALLWGRAALRRRQRLDYLNGAGGVLRVLLLAHEMRPDGRALELAKEYGDQFVANAIYSDRGAGWQTDLFPAPIGGFSHGSGGIMWILAQLSSVVGDVRYEELAFDALRFERSLFRWDRDTWFDLRYSEVEPGTSAQWCHGTGGIALSRALLLRYRRNPRFDDELRRDLERAVDLTLGATTESDCLCHGSLGNADICLTAAAIAANANWADRARQMAASSLHDARKRGSWRSGVPSRNVDLIGLFMGAAGVAYGLLRVVRPDLPSVLCLDQFGEHAVASPFPS